MNRQRGAVALVALALLAMLALAGAGWWYFKAKSTGSGAGLAEPVEQAGKASGELRGALDELPGDSLAVSLIADFEDWRRSFERTEVGELLADPELKQKFEAAIATTENRDGGEAVDKALELLAELDPLGVKGIAASVYPLAVEGAEPFGVAMVISSDDPKRVVDWLLAKSKEAGGEAPEPTRGETGGVDFECRDELCVAVRDGSVLLAAPRAGIEHVLSGAAGRLSDSERVAAAMAATGAQPGGSFGFLEMRGGVETLRGKIGSEAMAELDAPGPELEKMFELLGTDGWDYMAYADATRDGLFEGRLVFHYDRARAGLLGVLLESPEGEPTVDRMLPSGSTAAGLGRLDDPAATYDKLLDEIRAMLDEPQRSQLDQQLQMTKMLGFDLRDDLFATFGGEMGVAYTMDAAALLEPDKVAEALDDIRFQMVVGVVDQPRLESLLARLDAFGVVAATHEIGDGKLRELAVPVEGMAPAVALADGWLVLGTHGDDVRGALDGSLRSLADDPRYREARDRLPKAGGWFSYQGTVSMKLEDVLAQLRDRMESSKGQQQATYESVSAAAGAIQAYVEATGQAPSGGVQVLHLREALVPAHTDDLAVDDGWGRPLHYARSGAGYVVWSHGADGEPDRDWSECASGCAELTAPVSRASDDIVAASGSFIRWPGDAGGEGEIPAEVVELVQAFDERLSGLSPSVAVVRSTDAGMRYDMLAPVPVMAFAGIGLAAAATVGTTSTEGSADSP